MECCSPEFCSAWSVWVYSCVERPWKLALAALLARLLSSSERSPGPRESSTLAVQSFPAAHFSFPPFLCWLVQQCCSRPAPWPAKQKIWPSRISPQNRGWLSHTSSCLAPSLPSPPTTARSTTPPPPSSPPTPP